jgi:hypothetical protein
MRWPKQSRCKRTTQRAIARVSLGKGYAKSATAIIFAESINDSNASFSENSAEDST